jgi:hypothetical protein
LHLPMKIFTNTPQSEPVAPVVTHGFTLVEKSVLKLTSAEG